MKKLSATTIIPLGMSIAIAAMMVACAGQSTDPLKKYGGSKSGTLTAGPLTDDKSDTQEAFPEHPFIIDLDGSNSNNYGEFMENKESSAQIRVVENNQPGSKFVSLESFQILDFPSVDQPKLTRSQKDPSLFTITWTPKAGTVPPGKLSQIIRFHVMAISTNGLASEKTPLMFVVTKNADVPKIVGTSGIDNITTEEGKVIPFTVDVKDTGYVAGGNLPELRFTEYVHASPEGFRGNASSKIEPNYDIKPNPQAIGNNTFRFYRLMRLTDIAAFRNRQGKVDASATSVHLCFNVDATSSTKVLSGENQYCFNVKYLAQEVKLTWAQKELKAVSGEKNSFSFKLSTENGLSKIAIRNTNSQIASLSGKKSLDCKNDDAAPTVTCNLEWTPACGAKNIKKYPLTLKVESSLNQKTRFDSIATELEQIDSDVNCAAPVKPAAPAKKVTTPVKGK